MTYQLQIIFPILFFNKKIQCSQFLTYSSPSKTRYHLLCIHLISTVTNWSTLRPLMPYTTHQEFLTRPLEGPDQRLRGQLAIILQLDTIKEDAPKDSHQISRVKQPGQDDAWKMSYLGSERILSLIYFSRSLCYLSKENLFSLCVHWTWSRDAESFQHVPSLCLCYHWGAGLQTKCFCAWNWGSNFFSCWSEVTCRLKPDNPRRFRTPLQQLQRSLISLLTTHLSSRAEKAGEHLKWVEKKSAREKETWKAILKEEKKWSWNLETAVRGNEVSNWSFKKYYRFFKIYGIEGKEWI